MINLTEILQKMFEARDQIHFWHLQTRVYAEHKALNEFYDEWLDLADQFIETSQGRYDWVKGTISINLNPFNSNEISIDYLKGLLKWIQTEPRKLLQPEDTDLNNILDEMQALISHTIYLLNLN